MKCVYQYIEPPRGALQKLIQENTSYAFISGAPGLLYTTTQACLLTSISIDMEVLIMYDKLPKDLRIPKYMSTSCWAILHIRPFTPQPIIQCGDSSLFSSCGCSWPCYCWDAQLASVTSIKYLAIPQLCQKLVTICTGQSKSKIKKGM